MSSVAIEESSTLTSNSVQYRLMHKWTITDFSTTHLASPYKYSPTASLCSAKFGSSEDKRTQYRVTFRPRGVWEKYRNCIQLHLETHQKSAFPYKPMQATCKVSILNESNEKCYTKEFRSEQRYLGSSFYYYLAHSLLLDPANRLLLADQLTILAEIEVYPEIVGQLGNELLLARHTWEARANIADSLGTLLNRGEHTDVVLVIKKSEDCMDSEDSEDDGDYEYEENNEENLHVHKNILSLHSPVFNAMFKSELVKPNEGCRFWIPDMDYYVAEKMIDFIYTGTVHDLKTYAEDLYEAAEKYGITRLKELCCQTLCDKVDTYNATGFLAFADRHSIDQLKSKCVDFIRQQKMEDIVLDKNWSLVEKLFTEELRLLKLKENEEKKKAKTPDGSSSGNQPASAKYHLAHKWIITEFASTFLGQTTHTATYPKITSVWFSSALDRQIQFRLTLYPRGKSGVSKDSLSLFLEVKHQRCPVIYNSTDINYKLSLLNSRNEKCHSIEYRREFKHSAPCWGIANFLKHTHLLDPAKGLLPADQLTIIAEVDVFPNKPGSEFPLGQIEWSIRENLSLSLGTLLDSGDYSDIVLVVKGQELAAHKNILSAQSPVFRAMYKSAMVEREEGRVLIQDLEVDVAKVLLRFIYTGVVEDLEIYAERLLIAADKYGITRLKALCCQYLCGRVDTDNAAAMLALADRHSVKQLKGVCVDFIRRHLEDVISTEHWSLVCKLFVKKLAQLKLKVKDEDKIKKDVKIPEESESTS